MHFRKITARQIARIVSNELEMDVEYWVDRTEEMLVFYGPQMYLPGEGKGVKTGAYATFDVVDALGPKNLRGVAMSVAQTLSGAIEGLVKQGYAE